MSTTPGEPSDPPAVPPTQAAKVWPLYVGLFLAFVLYHVNEKAILQAIAPTGSYVHAEGRKLTLRTLPGYRWRAEWAKLLGTVWVPGLQDSVWHITALSQKGYHSPQPGYAWWDTSKPAVWTPGLRHSAHANVVAASTEGRWEAAPGYQFISRDSLAVTPLYSVPATPPPRERTSDDTARSLGKLGVGALGCKLAESEEDDNVVTDVLKYGMRAKCEAMMNEAIGELTH